MAKSRAYDETLKETLSDPEEAAEYLNAALEEKVSAALYRMAQGNLSSVKPVGKGVAEYRIDFGPGYRVYIGQEADVVVILLGGGTKKGQNRDIRQAQERWARYKAGKR